MSTGSQTLRWTSHNIVSAICVFTHKRSFNVPLCIFCGWKWTNTLLYKYILFQTCSYSCDTFLLPVFAAQIQLKEIFETDTDIALVLELVTGGELFDRCVYTHIGCFGSLTTIAAVFVSYWEQHCSVSRGLSLIRFRSCRVWLQALLRDSAMVRWNRFYV